MRRISTMIQAALLAFLASTGCGDSASSGQESSVAVLAKSPSERASMEIAGAREWERLRKPKNAIEAYDRIAKDFPDSPQAKIATERISALKGTGGSKRKS